MIYMIRHAESMSNAGARTSSHGGAVLSENGKKQALALAEKLNFRPDLIVVSPFVRTRQTAAPLLEKYPETPVEVWPVQEFSFLDADRCNNTTQEERLPWVEAYFARNDPDYVDERDAESFNQMLSRVDDMLARLRKLRKRNVVVFSHGNFMRAVRLRLHNLPPELPVFVQQPVWENTAVFDLTSYL